MKNTTATIDNVTYTLSQQAHISDDGQTYQASAVSPTGDTVLVLWDITCTDSDDESNACDWSRPYLA